MYGRYCAACHGGSAASGVLNPDPGSQEAIRAVVIDGALEHNGMVSFASAIKPEGAEAIRQYLIKRANEDKELENK